jgi:hypothetical protein
MLEFAKAKEKPLQIDEWGVWGPDAAPFVEAMADFIRTEGLRAYSNRNSDAANP